LAAPTRLIIHSGQQGPNSASAPSGPRSGLDTDRDLPRHGSRRPDQPVAGSVRTRSLQRGYRSLTDPRSPTDPLQTTAAWSSSRGTDGGHKVRRASALRGKDIDSPGRHRRGQAGRNAPAVHQRREQQRAILNRHADRRRLADLRLTRSTSGIGVGWDRSWSNSTLSRVIVGGRGLIAGPLFRPRAWTGPAWRTHRWAPSRSARPLEPPPSCSAARLPIPSP
jgi:hypothetical protein